MRNSSLFDTIVLSIIIILFILGIPFLCGGYDVLYNTVIGTAQKDSQRIVYKNNKTYIEGKADDLARYKREYERADNEEDKKIIIINIQDEFSDFDTNKLKNDNLREFLEKALNNEL